MPEDTCNRTSIPFISYSWFWYKSVIMSHQRHSDLEDFYDAAADPSFLDELLEEGDEEQDGDYDLYLDPEDMDEEYDDDDYEDAEGDEDEYMDDEDDDEDDAHAADSTPVFTIEQLGSDEEGDDSGQTFLNLAALLNQTGTPNEARQSLLARLLSGPITGGGASRGILSRITRGEGRGPSPEERLRLAEERRKKDRAWWTPQKEPHPKGLELLKSGEFGRVGEWKAGTKRRPRAAGIKKHQWVPTPAQATLPNTNGTVVASYPSIPYVGQYAGEDYSLFYAATQYFTIHLYNTNQARPTPKRPRERYPAGSATSSPEMNFSSPPRMSQDDDDEADYTWGSWGSGRRGMAEEDTSMKKIKNVQGVEGSWTVTDCDADRKGEKMIYSSITPYVHMLYTNELDDDHIMLDFSGGGGGRRRGVAWGYDSFGIWSIRFSADGKEVVAGAGGGRILVYDIESQTRTLSVPGHADDVNAVCFADETSTNILVSGSDDGYVKIWDRRSLSSTTPSGVLPGATEGITYVDSRGDARYLVVNSKDQAARLYDIRKMRSWSEFEGEPDAVSRYGQPRYDYRNSRYPPPTRLAHPADASVMTFRGHSVLRTLIRCHFSPKESTGQSYIYSGSADGMIHVWSLDGRVVQFLNRAESVPLRASNGQYNDPSAPEPVRRQRRYGAQVYESGLNYTCRDVSWHGYEPTLMSTCWEVDAGYRRGGTVAKHEWKGLGKGGLKRLEDWVEQKRSEGEEAGWDM
ncbi:WD40-repeat-containing domain protein [Naematelia encephala]|uniref:WD40-repeat-containing domain protein n=1 Tax=Naematelia encephala TaxID=71784 RepID=A0A1Y2AL15_9TREE|nr:WD40-repeat-containing domain protein [Naematelia encephala]